jgi:hypothetical protein
MMNNLEGAFAKNAVKGMSTANPLRPRRGMLKKYKGKQQQQEPLKVTSTRVVTEEPTKVKPDRIDENPPPIRVWSERVYPPQEAIGQGQRSLPAPPAKQPSKPRKPRDVKYTQPPLPGMRNKAQFRGKSGKG